MSFKTSIILCTYNEANHIEACINLISKTLKNVEIIIVDDNSNDGTLEKLDKLKSTFNFKLLVRKNKKGLASAQKMGFDESTGDFVGTISIPIAVGTVGGASSVHPTAKACLKILGVKSAGECQYGNKS